MKKYEYTTGYLLSQDARDVNNIVRMMNYYGEDHWHFTGYAKDVQNGTFYFFARVKNS